MEIIKNKNFLQERALYGLSSISVTNCIFAGEEDGESPLKECKDVTVGNCRFDLRYPFWHNEKTLIKESVLSDKCRAPMWYCNNLEIQDCNISGVKALRESENIFVDKSDINSEEFCWKCKDIIIRDTVLQSVYPFFMCSGIKAEKLNMTAKYSFQYCSDGEISDSVFNTKDAFWHAKNITVRNSTVKGEYLGWYSENLRLINCRIESLQPFCYAKNLILENCSLENSPLAFERSEVYATINGTLESVYNPAKGKIEADNIKETVFDGYTDKNGCEIIIRGIN